MCHLTTATRWLGIVALVVGLLGCGDDQDPEGARLLWQSIQEQEYRTWSRPSGYESRVPAQSPHSDHVDVYINDVVEEALGARRLEEWPVGSRIVKDGFDDDGDLEIVAVMEKREDGWYWAEYDDEGDSFYSGHPSTCLNCHSTGSDYVFTARLP